MVHVRVRTRVLEYHMVLTNKTSKSCYHIYGTRVHVYHGICMFVPVCFSTVRRLRRSHYFRVNVNKVQVVLSTGISRRPMKDPGLSGCWWNAARRGKATSVNNASVMPCRLTRQHNVCRAAAVAPTFVVVTPNPRSVNQSPTAGSTPQRNADAADGPSEKRRIERVVVVVCQTQ